MSEADIEAQPSLGSVTASEQIDDRGLVGPPMLAKSRASPKAQDVQWLELMVVGRATHLLDKTLATEKQILFMPIMRIDPRDHAHLTRRGGVRMVPGRVAFVVNLPHDYAGTSRAQRSNGTRLGSSLRGRRCCSPSAARDTRGRLIGARQRRALAPALQGVIAHCLTAPFLRLRVQQCSRDRRYSAWSAGASRCWRRSRSLEARRAGVRCQRDYPALHSPRH
jgi:hypothetical protein